MAAQLDTIIEEIEAATNTSLAQHQLSSIGGGCINTAYQIQTGDHDFFVKLNRPSLVDMFEAEAQGLQEIANTQSVRVPEVVCFGTANDHSYLVLEYIPLSSLRGKSASVLGEQLATMHKIEQPYFGWHIDNTIGSTPQINDHHNDWVSFWQQERLQKQLEFAERNGFGRHIQQQGEKLVADIPVFFENYQPHPSLLHGDLWGGNAASDDQGNPVVFDPACYYGDRETDLAMTELFGGFGHDFQAAYRAVYPIDSGYSVRKTLYNLYHILNHANMFGGGYLGQAESMIERLLAEIR